MSKTKISRPGHLLPPVKNASFTASDCRLDTKKSQANFETRTLKNSSFLLKENISAGRTTGVPKKMEKDAPVMTSKKTSFGQGTIYVGLPLASLPSASFLETCSKWRKRKEQEKKQKEKAREKLTKVGAVSYELPKPKFVMQEVFKERDNRLNESSKRRKIRMTQEKALLEHSLDTKHSNHMKNIETNEKRTRQEGFLSIIYILAIVPNLLLYISEENDRRKQNCIRNAAAARIQRYLQKMSVHRVILNAHKIKNKLLKMRWRITFWVRTTKRRLHAQVIRNFFTDFSILHMEYVVHRFRLRVSLSQRLVRRYLECQHARKAALLILWEKLVPDVAKIVRQRKIKKNQVVEHQPQQPQRRINSDNVVVAIKLKRQLKGIRSKGMLDTSIVIKRALCKFHLEDQRREHNERTTVFQDEKANNPEVHIKDAQDLLAGAKLDIDQLLGKKIWPMFRLFSSSSRAHLRNKIHSFLVDEDAVQEQVESRLNKEAQESSVNRYLNVPRTRRLSRIEIEKLNDAKFAEDVELAKLYNTTPSDIQELRETFSLVDKSDDGIIDSKELAVLLSFIGVQKDSDEIQELIDIVTTGRSEMNFEDFMKTLRGKRPIPTYSKERLLGAFSFFAKGTTLGQIRKEDLLKALMSYDGKWDVTRAINTIHDATLLAPVIDYHDYVKAMYRIVV